MNRKKQKALIKNKKPLAFFNNSAYNELNT